MKKICFIVFAGICFFACSNQPESEKKESTNDYARTTAGVFGEFEGLGKIWYQGKAEVSRYDLEQNRYNGVHPGELIMIFVTEDFLTDKQVKNDNYSNPNSTPVFKNNQLRKFTTGLYDYSIMTSVFTPTKVKEYPFTEKITTSAQDWCGQAFMQINKNKGGGFQMQLLSYFENEGDQNISLEEDAILEDELFNRIRMNPEALPVGKIRLYPGTLYTRLAHKPFGLVDAEASMDEYIGEEFSGKQLQVYRLHYPGFDRSLEIVFEKKEPYQIEGWIETYSSAFDKKNRRTVAKRTSTEWIDYWAKNQPGDRKIREQLGINGF